MPVKVVESNLNVLQAAKIRIRNVFANGCKIYLSFSSGKAWLSTTVPDCMYYEATYDGDKKELRLDAYRKIQSVSIPC